MDIRLEGASLYWTQHGVSALKPAPLFSAPALVADKLELLLDWFINPDHGPIAQRQGYFAEQGLEKHGLNLGDIEMVNINWSLSPSLISGQVDAVIGAFRNFELNKRAWADTPTRFALRHTTLNAQRNPGPKD